MKRDIQEIVYLYILVIIVGVLSLWWMNSQLNAVMNTNVDQSAQTSSVEATEGTTFALFVPSEGYNSPTDLLQTAAGVNFYLQNQPTTVPDCATGCEPIPTTNYIETGGESEQNTNTDTPGQTETAAPVYHFTVSPQRTSTVTEPIVFGGQP